MDEYEEIFKVVLGDLLAVVPEFQPVVDEHVADYDEVLAYILLVPITACFLKLCRESMSKPFTIEKLQPKLSQVLQILENAHAQGEDLRTLVSLSFIEELNINSTASERVCDILPTRLRAEWEFYV